MKYVKSKFFSFTGRIGRKEFASSYFFIILLALFITIIVPQPEVVNQTGNFLYSFILLAGGIALAIIGMIAFLSIAVRRLNDLNYSPYYVFLTFIPFVNLVFSLFLIFISGAKKVTSEPAITTNK